MLSDGFVTFLQPRDSSCRAVSRLRPSRLGLRHSFAGSPHLKTESSFFRTDRSFAFRCSPPRLAATQLRSALINERLIREDSHLPIRVRSRAHERRRPRRLNRERLAPGGRRDAACSAAETAALRS